LRWGDSAAQGKRLGGLTGHWPTSIVSQWFECCAVGDEQEEVLLRSIDIADGNAALAGEVGENS